MPLLNFNGESLQVSDEDALPSQFGQFTDVDFSNLMNGDGFVWDAERGLYVTRRYAIGSQFLDSRPPANAVRGDTWINEANLKQFVLTRHGWFEVFRGGGSGGVGGAVHLSDVPPSGPERGTVWINEANLKQFVFTRHGWFEVYRSSGESRPIFSDTPPPSARSPEGAFWLDTSDDTLHIHRLVNGELQWLPVGGGSSVGSSANLGARNTARLAGIQTTTRTISTTGSELVWWRSGGVASDIKDYAEARMDAGISADPGKDEVFAFAFPDPDVNSRRELFVPDTSQGLLNQATGAAAAVSPHAGPPGYSKAFTATLPANSGTWLIQASFREYTASGLASSVKINFDNLRADAVEAIRGRYVSDTPPSNPRQNDEWVTTEGRTFLRRGSAWFEI